MINIYLKANNYPFDIGLSAEFQGSRKCLRAKKTTFKGIGSWK
jgi:hypothetical protein